MSKKLHIKKGDLVKVLAGNARGSEGKVLTVDVQNNRAIVEGVNKISKHTKPNAKSPNGGIVEQEASVHVSNLMLIEPASGTPTRVGRKLDEETNKLVRISKKSGEVIK
ncbi:MAG: 50S ribosomal protein L24 [Bacteroidetes bacterium]|nr:50S ribosomal protein L24 [Bacteroidota bacterium]MBL7892436.1 50S ribosomal protein L24 [Bacteroidia bacterium]